MNLNFHYGSNASFANHAAEPFDLPVEGGLFMLKEPADPESKRIAAIHGNQNMIFSCGLSRRFGSTLVVDDLSFDLPIGSICACLGPNGAGKSTAIKLLTGVLAPSSGRATVAGFDVLTSPWDLKRNIGVLPERLGLFDHLTIEEHLHLVGPIYGLSSAETRRRTDQIIRVLSLEDGRHTFADHLSMGMRKKTALALSLIHNPKVLFLDEPFESIDPASALVVRDLLGTLPSRGMTVFFTAHSLSMAERIATHYAFLDHGRLVRLATSDEILTTLEDAYFDLLPPVKGEDLPWLGR